MNTSRETLKDALASWRVAPTTDPAFRSHVWERIRKRPDTAWADYLRAHAAALSLVSLLALAAAALGGGVIARSRVRADREAIVMTYLVDIDPRVQAAQKP